MQPIQNSFSFQKTSEAPSKRQKTNAKPSDDKTTIIRSQRWSNHELASLARGYQEFNQDWEAISIKKLSGTRTPQQCEIEFHKLLDLNKAAQIKANENSWSEPELQLLKSMYAEVGPQWNLISQTFTNKTPADCQTRFDMDTPVFAIKPASQFTIQRRTYWRKKDTQTLLEAYRKGEDWETIASRYFNNKKTAAQCKTQFMKEFPLEPIPASRISLPPPPITSPQLANPPQSEITNMYTPGLQTVQQTSSYVIPDFPFEDFDFLKDPAPIQEKPDFSDFPLEDFDFLKDPEPVQEKPEFPDFPFEDFDFSKEN